MEDLFEEMGKNSFKFNFDKIKKVFKMIFLIFPSIFFERKVEDILLVLTTTKVVYKGVISRLVYGGLATTN